jgi:hypothetical protein
MPRLETESMNPGGWPDASLPEHVSLGKFDFIPRVCLESWTRTDESERLCLVIADEFYVSRVGLRRQSSLWRMVAMLRGTRS